MSERYTQGEVGRILGVGERQLNYWRKLRLVRPQVRWGERFYTFADIVAVQTIHQLTAQHSVPARRLRRAVAALEQQLGEVRAPLSQLRILANGREVAVVPPGGASQPFEPLTGQFVLDFSTRQLADKVRAMAPRTAAEWFEIGLTCDTDPEKLLEAVEAYQHTLAIVQDWAEAHMHLGTALYQLGRPEESKRAFRAALAIEPADPTAHFRLGCVLDELGEINLSIEHLRRAAQLAPQDAEVRLNLALAFEKAARTRQAREEWSAYLGLEPSGPWADYARARLGRPRARGRVRKLTPFRPQERPGG